MNKKRRNICIVMAVALPCLIVLVCVFLLYGSGPQRVKKVEFNQWGISFVADGELLDKNALTIEQDRKSVNICYKSSADGIKKNASNSQGFRFALSGSPEVELYCDSTIRIRSVFLKADNYAAMNKVSISKSDFLPNTYYISKDGSSFTLATSFDESDADYYYKFERLGTVNSDYYPLLYSLTGENQVEGLYYAGTTDKNSLYYISAGLSNALANGVRVETKIEEGNPNTAVFQVTGSTFQQLTDLSSWVKFTGENMTWSRASVTTQGYSDVAERVLDKLQDGSAVVVKYAGLGLNEQIPKNATAVSQTDYCLDTAFEWNICFRTK